MPYIKSICRAGKTKEIAKYYTRRFQPKGEKRLPKQKETTERQKKANNRQLAKKLTRILNANFDETSWYLTLSYKKENRLDIEGVKNQVREFLKKLRKLYRDNECILKYVETAEIGERGAMHIHIVINDIDIREVKRLWKYGFVTATPLESSGQYRKLAEYFIKYFQKTRGTNEQIQKKAYNCSRNLKRPEPERHVMNGEHFRKEIRVPQGWYIDKESVREGFTEDGYDFFYYTLIQIQQENIVKNKPTIKGKPISHKT